MSRPIPEGVKPPVGCVILGWGGTFKVPDSGIIRGYYLDDLGWETCATDGENPDDIYAVPADSEVARLNQPKDNLEEAIFGAGNCRGDIAFNNHCGSCARCKSYGWTKAQDKDAIIRELVGALEGLLTSWRDKSKEGHEYLHGVRLASIKADATLTLARTTCPEAFE